MKYLTAYYTDKGKRKNVNQDSLLISQGRIDGRDIVLAVICDGMGGLRSGELASAEVIRSFAVWFGEEFQMLAEQEDFEDVLYDSWEILLKNVHEKIRSYGQFYDMKMGTTITAMLFWRENYYIVHLGDSRIYEIKDETIQLTKDQTLAELMRADEKMKTAASRSENVLIQAIGSSKVIRPAYYSGTIKSDAIYLMCSDGFRHKISNQELKQIFAPSGLIDENVMEERARNVVRKIMDRGERDNISVLLIRTMLGQDKYDSSGVDVQEKMYIPNKETIIVHTEEIM